MENVTHKHQGVPKISIDTDGNLLLKIKCEVCYDYFYYTVHKTAFSPVHPGDLIYHKK